MTGARASSKGFPRSSRAHGGGPGAGTVVAAGRGHSGIYRDVGCITSRALRMFIGGFPCVPRLLLPLPSSDRGREVVEGSREAREAAPGTLENAVY